MSHPGNRLVYAPGMGVAEDLTGGAAGDYDAYWKALGESLVAAGYPDAIIRIAHEFRHGRLADHERTGGHDLF